MWGNVWLVYNRPSVVFLTIHFNRTCSATVWFLSISIDGALQFPKQHRVYCLLLNWVEPKWLVLVEAFLRSILNHSQKALYITGLWLPVKKKIYDFEKLKTFRGWVPMNFHGTIKNCYWWFPMISGHGTEKLFSMGIEILGLMCLDAKNGFCDSRRIATLT